MGRTLRSFDARFATANARLREVIHRSSDEGCHDKGYDEFDWVAYYRDMVEAHSAMAAVYTEAQDVVEPGNLAWSALYDAAKVHLDSAEEAGRSLTAYLARVAGAAAERVA
ncbi:hypothetical protein ACQPZF_01000 [Actinosynnema sp. CS-041913]|uniref:hypothetical protein n=1 Tax=Actinosynnema sp. CS-041913 TaxID=3239917 RepID=UPI003D9388D0